MVIAPLVTTKIKAEDNDSSASRGSSVRFDNIHARFNLPPRRIIRRHEREGGGGGRMRVIGRKWFALLTVDGWKGCLTGVQDKYF